MRALVGGIGSLGGAVLALTVLGDSTAAVFLAVLATWCLFGAWFTHRFASR